MSHAESKKMKKNVKSDQKIRKDNKVEKSSLVVKSVQKGAGSVTTPTSV